MTDTTRPHAATTSPPVVLGRSIGRYLLLDRVGRGGCGEVYRAFDPMLDRKVAIKVLHRQGTSETEILNEGRLLARFTHPNVVPVFDVGIDDGRVFLAMQYVGGGDLRQWLKDGAPTGAVEALAGVAEGLAAAHAAGIVHGDIKPGNVLLADDGRLLLSDFGIARTAAITARGSTEPEAAGTPAFMAPELSRGPASQRSDQYSFCVMARSLLEGRRLPPQIAAALDRGRSTSPDDRWPSMDTLVQILTRRPPSRGIGVLAVSALVVGGLAAAANSDAPDPCESAADETRELWTPETQAVVASAIEAAGGAETDRAWIRTHSQVDRYVEDLAGMRTNACNALARRGDDDDAVLRQDICLDRAQFHLGTMIRALQEPAQSVDRLVETLPKLEHCLDPDEPPVPPAIAAEVVEAEKAVTELSVALAAGRRRDASGLYERLQLQTAGLDFPPLRTRVDLLGAYFYRTVDRAEDAVPLYERALDTSVEHGLDFPAYKAAMGLAAVLGHELDRHEQSVLYGRLGVRFAIKIDGNGAEEGNARAALASALSSAGNTEAGLEQMERALALSREAYGEMHRRVAIAHNDLSIDLRSLGRLDECEHHRRKSIEIREEVLGPTHPETLRSRTNLVALLPMLGKAAEAEKEAKSLLALVEASQDSTSYDRMMVLMALADAQSEQDHRVDAIETYREVLRQVDPSRARHRQMRAVALGNLAAQLGNDGNCDEAEIYYAQAVDLRSATLPEDHPKLANLRMNRALNLLACGRLESARADADLALAALRDAKGVDQDQVARAALTVGSIALAQGEIDTARRELEHCLGTPQLEDALAAEARRVLARLDDGDPRSG